MAFTQHARPVGPAAHTPELHETESGSFHRLGGSLRRAILRTRQWLLSEQHADGYWVGELEGDTILESEYILLLAYLGEQSSDQAVKAGRYIQKQQLAGGGWALYLGGGVDVGASVKAYFALKLTGHAPSAEHMQRARAAILAHGGADAVNSFTRFYLALLGQIPYDQCPAVPPEMVLLPKWAPINLYRMSSWSRTILVPLAIMWAFQPVTQLDPRFGISELFLKPPAEWPPLRCPGSDPNPGLLSWDRFFRAVDKALKFFQRARILPFRRRALAAAERWMLERFAGSEGLGAIFPPMIFSIIALRSLGYAASSAEMQYCRRVLDGLILDGGESIRLQPCKSPVWDTAIALRALEASGLEPRHPAMQRAVDWLLANQISRRGDWAETVSAVSGGWCFEHANEFYPDVDDTIMVLMSLRGQMSEANAAAKATGAGGALPPELRVVDQQAFSAAGDARRHVIAIDKVAAAAERGLAWVLAMQNRDGGWGAFDRDNDHEFLCHVPFADHNAMIDPSTPDLAGRVLEMLAHFGYRVGGPQVDRAVAYIRASQEPDGSWFGRWGVNYVYGTWQALVGLSAVGVPASDSMIKAGVNWLLAYQQPNGGWGESPDSYAEPRLRGQGPTTASQTAWALLGLLAAGEHAHPAVARGVRYLVERQRTDGTWDEPEFTGTGFPQVFYLRYHLYPMYFPLLALSTWATAIGERLEEAETLQQLLATTEGK
jgi:squalene-hopene/tetraprenyl-beta-curcumene cyclase